MLSVALFVLLKELYSFSLGEQVQIVRVCLSVHNQIQKMLLSHQITTKETMKMLKSHYYSFEMNTHTHYTCVSFSVLRDDNQPPIKYSSLIKTDFI